MPARSSASTPEFRYLIESLPGLTGFTVDELDELVADRRLSGRYSAIGDEIVCHTANADVLYRLRTAQAVYDTEAFEVPRPKALLGDQYFRRLTGQVQRVLGGQPRGTFHTLHLAAAGADSSVMTRIKSDLASAVGLSLDDEVGDLLVRVRKSPQHPDQWETLVRLTPRPLATRYWRECDMPGALNATVAHVMSRLASPQPDTLVNLMSGSGSIAIEHTLKRPGALALALDNSAEVLACSRQNATAAHVADAILHLEADTGKVPLPPRSVDALAADMPFGQKVGSHQENVRLYPRVLREAARIARRHARFVILTHEIRLIESILGASEDWHVEAQHPITLRGLHPRLYLLVRR